MDSCKTVFGGFLLFSNLLSYAVSLSILFTWYMFYSNRKVYLIKKVIYSVGKDLKDEGGMSREEGDAWWRERKDDFFGRPLDPIQLPDPSFPVEF